MIFVQKVSITFICLYQNQAFQMDDTAYIIKLPIFTSMSHFRMQVVTSDQQINTKRRRYMLYKKLTEKFRKIQTGFHPLWCPNVFYTLVKHPYVQLLFLKQLQ